MPKQPIAIIGAGLAGLTLGRSLLAAGIPAVIYEKASANKSRYNYGISLSPKAYVPLMRILGVDESTLRNRVGVPSIPGSSSGDKDGEIPPLSNSGALGELRVHRQRLEEMMREGIDIRWEHAIGQIQLTDEHSDKHGAGIRLIREPKDNNDDAGNKTARDESVFTHDCVIAADGPHSVARKAHVSAENQLHVLQYVALNGKRRIPKDVFQSHFAPAFAEARSISISTYAENGALLQIDAFDQTPDTISVNWTYSRKPFGDGDVVFKPNRPNAGATDIPKEFYTEIDGLQLNRPFSSIFDAEELRNERVLSWLMRTCEIPLLELQRLAEQGLCFIGDAAHAEPILGGHGANDAIADGIALTEWISEHGASAKSLNGWYAEHFPTWAAAVQASKQRIEEMHSPGRKSVL